MRSKKIKLIINFVFMLLGLALVFFTLNDGFATIYDWLSLILGSLVAIINFLGLVNINKENTDSNNLGE